MKRNAERWIVMTAGPVVARAMSDSEEEPTVWERSSPVLHGYGTRVYWMNMRRQWTSNSYMATWFRSKEEAEAAAMAAVVAHPEMLDYVVVERRMADIAADAD